jgi:glycosyltransferase involved in cell wall biosynthesis
MMVTLYAALAADHLAFNTNYNRHTFLTGVDRLLHKLPDHVPINLVEQLRQKSSVIPVPLPAHCFTSRQDSQNTDILRIVWNHRWEYDKGPDRLLAIMRELKQRGTEFRMYILGQQFRKIPKEFDTIKKEFSHHIDQFGYAESKEEYFEWLSRANIVLSTAVHEFQGLSVLEAVAKGCIPVLPNRLVYPELFGQSYVYKDCGDDIKKEAQAAADLIEHQGELIKNSKARTPSTRKYSWSELGASYTKLIEDLADKSYKV